MSETKYCQACLNLSAAVGIIITLLLAAAVTTADHPARLAVACLTISILLTIITTVTAILYKLETKDDDKPCKH